MIHETPQDRNNEENVLSHFSNHFSYDLLTFPQLSTIDGCFSREGVVEGVGEAKRRQHRMGKYPTLMLDAAKLRALQEHALSLKTWAVVIIRYDDVDAYAIIDPQRRYMERIGGRTDRGDPHDVGTMAHVPIEDFIVLPESRQAA